MVCGHDAQGFYTARECPSHKRFNYIIIVIIIDFESPPPHQYTVCAMCSWGVTLFKQVPTRAYTVRLNSTIDIIIIYSKKSTPMWFPRRTYINVMLCDYYYYYYGIRRDWVENVYSVFVRRDIYFFFFSFKTNKIKRNSQRAFVMWRVVYFCLHLEHDNNTLKPFTRNAWKKNRMIYYEYLMLTSSSPTRYTSLNTLFLNCIYKSEH